MKIGKITKKLKISKRKKLCLLTAISLFSEDLIIGNKAFDKEAGNIDNLAIKSDAAI